MAEDIRKRIGPKEAEILEGHLVMISDPSMSGEMNKMIAAGQCAEAAVEAVCDMFIGMFSKMDDDMMRQRASDISDVKVSLLKILLGIEDVDISKVAPGTILVAKDLTPSMTSQIRKENVAGIITEVGGKTSHSAILARALEIPAVLSVLTSLLLLRTRTQQLLMALRAMFTSILREMSFQAISSSARSSSRNRLSLRTSLEKKLSQPTVQALSCSATSELPRMPRRL
jgi:phosphoenolpyruvate-protein kinase (PTS system EI component)